jgi:hypothetical protein
MVKAEPVSHQESAAAPTLMQSQCTTAAVAAGITAAASIAGLHKVEPPDPSPPPPTTVNTAAPEPVVKAEPVLHQESAAAPTLMQSECTTISDDEPVSHQESRLTTAFAAAAVLCPQAAAAAAAAGITATSIAASPELSTADTPAYGTEPPLANWRTQFGDNRDLENRSKTIAVQATRQVPLRSGKVRKRGTHSRDANVEGAHARDASKVRCTMSRERLNDECVKTLLCNQKQLAQMFSGFSEILKGEILRATDIQQSLGCDVAMKAALSSHLALSIQRLNMISADSDQVVKDVSSKLSQLELFSTAGSATSVSQLQLTRAGLDQVASSF